MPRQKPLMNQEIGHASEQDYISVVEVKICMFARRVHGHVHMGGVPISAEVCPIHGNKLAYLAACLMVKL
jgi:hypothetical protein